MALIVVESPTKARTFNRILKIKNLSDEYFVFATVGHFRDLPSARIAVDFDKKYQPEYEIMERKMKMVDKLKELAKEHDKIILATDLDREGESISYHVAYILGFVDEKWPDFELKNKSKLERIVFHEITPSALQEALDNPSTLRTDLVKAQQARRILDRVVGYKLSPLLWKKMGKNWLSAGRVQTVALRLIAEREKEIEKFAKDPYFEITGLFESAEEISAKLISRNGESYQITNKIELFDGSYEFSKTSIDKKQSEEIQAELKDETYTVESITKNEANRFPPPPFTTSLLQQDAFRKLRFPSKLTMRVAQSLYEKGLITYHRTDSFNLSSKYVFAAKDYIVSAYGNKYALDKPRGYRTKSKNAQEAHEAIRPTKAERTLASMKKKLGAPEKKLYELIFQRALATQMKEATIKESEIKIKSSKGYEFETVHKEILFDGFFRVLAPGYAKNNSTALELKDSGEISLKNLDVEEKETKPPYRYSEGSLIKTMEEKGIGRPSTYSSIISLIIDKHYVEKDFRFLKPTSLGASMSEYLSESFPDLFDLTFTAEMEDSLDQIAEGTQTIVQTLDKFYIPFEKELLKVSKDKSLIDIKEDMLEEKCPKCNSDLIARFGKYGKFYACVGYPKCKYIKPNLRFVKDYFCPDCKGRLVVRYSKTGKRFYGCENYPTCKHVRWALNVIPEKKDAVKKTPETKDSAVKKTVKKTTKKAKKKPVKKVSKK
ncbi:type I DNA topoisomerase [Candidatus Roizmanbacteria bacterium CG_4_10_14_0_2_um_filter_39_13]|uniref:DNA topoisomerase 1 n=1 Tax=Candidatus Roizmanbacteria bacterium CG_4_10_14_0_2_um_filter_39_13 TaxID=1974825 RepID=A0A2M7TVB8_9BACT|nr:MAG: type I DNA topoisomerase [Candidatus Roizmanbacteria bacterium CG_4_10_14_0_2_um_filter_39_13]